MESARDHEVGRPNFAQDVVVGLDVGRDEVAARRAGMRGQGFAQMPDRPHVAATIADKQSHAQARIEQPAGERDDLPEVGRVDFIRRRTIDLSELASYWIERVEHLLRACVRDRDAVPVERSIDVRFHEYMADQTAVIRRVYAMSGLPLTPDTESRIGGYLAAWVPTNAVRLSSATILAVSAVKLWSKGETPKSS